MAGNDSRKATPRTAAKPAPSAKKPVLAPKKAPAKQQGGKKRVVLAEPRRERSGGGIAANPARLFGMLGRVAIALAILAVVCVIGFNILRMTPIFTITSIDTQATEHLSEQDIANLAGVVEGTTLLDVDEAVVAENLKRNPWVLDVKVHREFPDKLAIEVQERTVQTIVLLNTSAFAWYIGEGDVWLEPATLTLGEGQTAKDAALALASQKGALLIIDVPATVNPTAGSEVADDVLLAVNTYVRELPEELSSQIVYFSASSLEGIACILSNGVEVSLGSPTQIEQKVAVLTQILEQYPGEITYINVRVPANPSYRRIDSDTVQPGSGA